MAVFVGRHGHYDEWSEDEGLTDKGRAQASKMGMRLRDKLNGSIGFYSSRVLRAIQTMEKVRSELEIGVEIVTTELLEWTGNNITPDGLEELYSFVRGEAEKVDNVLLMTHYAVVNNFQGLYLQKNGLATQRVRLNKGQGVLIDFLGESNFELIY